MQDPFPPLLSQFLSQVMDEISAYGLDLQTSPAQAAAHSPCAWEARSHLQPGAATQVLQPSPFPGPSPRVSLRDSAARNLRMCSLMNGALSTEKQHGTK